MTWEYWDHHCGLIGYSFKRTWVPQRSLEPLNFTHHHGTIQNVALRRSSDAIGTTIAAQAGGVLNVPPTHFSDILSVTLAEETPCFHSTPQEGVNLKSKKHDQLIEPKVLRRSSSMANIIDLDSDLEKQSASITLDLDEQAVNVIRENKKLRKSIQNENNRELQRLQSLELSLWMSYVSFLSFKCLDSEKTEKELEGGPTLN